MKPSDETQPLASRLLEMMTRTVECADNEDLLANIILAIASGPLAYLSLDTHRFGMRDIAETRAAEFVAANDNRLLDIADCIRRCRALAAPLPEPLRTDVYVFLAMINRAVADAERIVSIVRTARPNDFIGALDAFAQYFSPVHHKAAIHADQLADRIQALRAVGEGHSTGGVTITTAAKAIGVSLPRIGQLIVAGMLRDNGKSGKGRRVDASDVATIAAEHRAKSIDAGQDVDTQALAAITRQKTLRDIGQLKR